MTSLEEIEAAERRGARKALEVAAALYGRDRRSPLARKYNYEPVAHKIAQEISKSLERFASSFKDAQ